ncbi:MAG: hypothetical protein IT463_13955 [Planctomycetes bacterium]|nr:hypothetical protein [Planctomycetota bacterium]
MAKAPTPGQPNEGEVFREVATRKLEAERIRVMQLGQENEQLRAMAADLQKKISLANSRAAELERQLKQSAGDARRDQAEELQAQRELHERHLAEVKAAHLKELDRLSGRIERTTAKSEDALGSAQARLSALQDALDAEKQARTEAEARLRALDTAARRVGPRAGQVTGFETDSPEDLLRVLSELDAERPLKLLRGAVRELRSAASNVERAFVKAVKGDEGKAELHDSAQKLQDARAVPDTQELPPAPAMLMEEAFTFVADEVQERIKGRHYIALVGAMATELARVLRGDREDLSRLQRLADIAEGTELATAGRLLLKGATSHQQEIAAARLAAEELKQMREDAREQKGKVKKLYAVAETGMAGEWATAAVQSMAALKPLPAPDAEAMRRPVYHHVVECGRLVQERIDSAMNLGASAEAAVREADEAFAQLEALSDGMGELLLAARRELMSKVAGEQDARLKLQAARNTLAEAGKRGQRAAALFDRQLKHLDAVMGQWKATYKLYGSLSRDVARVESSIEGQMLDLNQPLETDEGRRLYQIIHDLSEHLPELRALDVMRQRLFLHLENPKQRPFELKQVREAAGRVLRALGEPDPHDTNANYQHGLARLYDAWACLEEVRGGSHSQLAVAGEQLEPVLADVMTWASSSEVQRLPTAEQAELLHTAAYVRRLKRAVLGIHDRGRTGANAAGLTDQFEHSLDTMELPPDWTDVLERIATGHAGEDQDQAPPTEREPAPPRPRK